MSDTQTPDTPARPKNYGTHAFLLACMAMVAAFLAWANIGQLDVVAVATGEVVPSSQVKSVQHLEGGIVRSILVKEGQKVVKNQPLIELEPTRSGAELGELTIRVAALQVSIIRLETEMIGGSRLEFPTEFRASNPDLVGQTERFFRTRMRRMASQLSGQRQQIIQREHEIKEIGVRLKNTANSLKLVREQLKISKRLTNLDLSNRMNHLGMLKEEAELKGRIEEDRARLPSSKAGLLAAKAQMDATKNGFKEEAATELADARRTFSELSQRIRTLEDSLRRTVLRAPVDGIIKTLYVVTQGGVIQAGKTVLDMVPGDDKLVIEARLATQDIGYVQLGQEARIQLASAEAARFGTLEGKVIHISPDTIVTREGMPYYKVRIQTERDFFESGNLRYRLSPGMQVQSSIQTGTRTVMRYILDPYIGKMGTALRER
jgi:membrane fusion protein, adhesin transport system